VEEVELEVLVSEVDYHFIDLDEDDLEMGKSLVGGRMCSLDEGIDWDLVFQIERYSIPEKERILSWEL